ncbi:MAG: glycosyltransferase N-terminal domain-containing protein [Rikenellaceae bacterium]
MFIYNLVIRLFSVMVRLVAGRNIKAKQMVEGRKNLFEKLAQKIDTNSEIVWFHSASLGEFEQGRPVIEEYRLRYPNRKILLTFFSPSGYEVRKNYEGVDYIFYIPYDLKKDVVRFLDIVKPCEVYFIKYEFWLNFMSEIKKRKIKFYIFSSIFDSKKVFFKPYGGIYRKALTAFTHIFVQDDNSKKLLSDIGVENVTVAGDTRFDRVYKIVTSSKHLPIVKSFKGDAFCMVCGSTWEPDDKIVCDLIRQGRENVKFIIAPHELGAEKIKNLVATLTKEGFKVVLYTESDEVNVKEADVLIINCIGILSSVYKYGEIAMIGGGFGVGIHNTLEAATFGLPMIFGGNYTKFKEARDLVAIKVATPITDSKDAILWFNTILDDTNKLKELTAVGANFVSSKIGATDIILNGVDQ